MKTKRHFLFWTLLLALQSPWTAWAAPTLSITVENAQETIRIALPDATPHKVFTLEKPNRLVVDVPHFPLKAAEQKAIGLPSSYKGGLVKAVRYGQFDANTSRFVFDLTEAVTIERATADEESTQLTVRIVSAAPKKPEKPMIVIDPGHGGDDPGAISPNGTQEKDIVLTYARALREKLLQSGKYRVILTREGDKFIALRKRIDIARKAEASLFISLHADSAPTKVSGLSIYTVSEEASDAEAEALAARENKADVIAGMDLSEEREDVAGILISLAQRETNNYSATLADFLVVALHKRVRLLQKSHRFAGFAVLKAPDIPSVLIELGFLSHRDDQKLLTSKSYRDKVTDGIVSGIDAYFRHRKKTEGQ